MLLTKEGRRGKELIVTIALIADSARPLGLCLRSLEESCHDVDIAITSIEISIY